MPKRITADEFAERVSKFTNGRISIVKETYTGTHNRVTAYCNVHKIYFEVGTANHLYRKRGNIYKANCPECHRQIFLNAMKNNINPWPVVLKTFIEAYGDKFSYDESSYIDTKHKMKIHCNDCGEDFELSPYHHLRYNNGGCPNCRKYKIQICSKCGKRVKVDSHTKITDNYICDDCIKEIKEKLKEEKKEKRAKEKRENAKQSRRKYRYYKNVRIGNCRICGRKLINGKCPNEFCNIHPNIDFNILSKYFGFDTTKVGTIYVEQEFQRIKDMLNDLYWTKHMSGLQINSLFSLPKNSIYCYFKLFGINKKSLSYAIKESIEENRVNQIRLKSKYELYITWQNKKIFLRSANEIKYAEYLDSKKILYEYEYFRIKYFDTQINDYRYAIPDFYLPETNTIVEIKSAFTLDVINMRDRSLEYQKLGYKFKLILDFKEISLNEILNNDLYDYDKNRNLLKRVYKYKKKDGWKLVNKDGVTKKCYTDEELEQYINEGWSIGTANHKNTAGTARVVRINERNQLEYKIIKRSELQTYLNNGWFKGKTPKYKILEIIRQRDKSDSD